LKVAPASVMQELQELEQQAARKTAACSSRPLASARTGQGNLESRDLPRDESEPFDQTERNRYDCRRGYDSVGYKHGPNGWRPRESPLRTRKGFDARHQERRFCGVASISPPMDVCIVIPNKRGPSGRRR
jgi:hypothetical protein